jgi:serine/threonine protein kinase
MERLRSGDPEQIGPWQIVNRLGSGGMGVVYMGTNGTRAAAIKVVREFLLEDPASRTRLTREVETLLRVKSDYVAEIVGSDIDGNPAWIATNYVDGPSLKVLIEKEGALSEEKWIEFAKGFLSSLASVHAVGVVHRDIKPSNILLSKTGPKLIDFGISFVNDATSLTGTGMVAGTPAWLAPEQFLGREITSAVDNFAAGSTLMFAATGKTPWGADDSSVGAVMHTILVEEPDLSALSEFQIEIITPLLVKDVQLRKTASQMLKKLNDGPKSLGIRSKRETNSVEKESSNFSGTLVLVTHGGTARCLLGSILKLPMPQWGVIGGLSNACWSVLELTKHHGDSRWYLAEHNAGSLPEPVFGDDAVN